MKRIDGRQYASRDDLIEQRHGSKSTLKTLWRERMTNGHPPAVKLDGIQHWDYEEWVNWRAELIRQRNATKRRGRRTSVPKVDRSGDPDEWLPPSQQAKVLDIELSTLSGYNKRPPAGWPAGDERGWRTRRQLWDYADHQVATDHRIGAAGRRPGPDPARAEAHQQRRQERRAIAAEAWEARTPDQSVNEILQELAEEHGGSPRTWERILSEARRQTNAG